MNNAREISGPTESTVKRLFALSGNKCAFPSCNTKAIDGTTVLGRVCHIKASRPGGKRFDAAQSSTERHGFDNLILLCPTDHAKIDDDDATYTVEVLIAMKQRHELNANQLSGDFTDRGGRLIWQQMEGAGIAAGTINANTINIHHGASAPGKQTSHAEILAIFAPELARVLKHQVYLLDRAIVNFSCSSSGQRLPGDRLSSFMPRKPILYPVDPSFRSLKPEDGALLVEFYDRLRTIEDFVSELTNGVFPLDMNAWNSLMQQIESSVQQGLVAVRRFCPARLYDETIPVAGRLIDRAEGSRLSMRKTLDAHIARWQAKANTQANGRRR